MYHVATLDINVDYKFGAAINERDILWNASIFKSL